jgi:hypothetical protein
MTPAEALAQALHATHCKCGEWSDEELEERAPAILTALPEGWRLVDYEHWWDDPAMETATAQNYGDGLAAGAAQERERLRALVEEHRRRHGRAPRPMTEQSIAALVARLRHPHFEEHHDDPDRPGEFVYEGICDSCGQQWPCEVERFAVVATPQVAALLREAERLRYAKAVATIWRDAVMAAPTLRETGMSHPLAMTLAAFDGETDPVQLGVSEADLAAALGEQPDAAALGFMAVVDEGDHAFFSDPERNTP